MFRFKDFLFDFIPIKQRLIENANILLAYASSLLNAESRYKDFRNGRDDYKEFSLNATYQNYDRVIKNGQILEYIDGSFYHYGFSKVGVDKSINFDVTTLKVDYALNYYFGTEFKQPPLKSVIWCENEHTSSSFVVFENSGTAVFENISTAEAVYETNQGLGVDRVLIHNGSAFPDLEVKAIAEKYCLYPLQIEVI